MSSPGTGAEITAQDADDLLHKLMTESTKVRAVFISGSGVIATVAGLLKKFPSGGLAVEERPVMGGPLIIFNPALAISRRYGDDRAFPALLPMLGPRLNSALVFVLPDGSQLALFELADR
jgi:hypothetical protein